MTSVTAPFLVHVPYFRPGVAEAAAVTAIPVGRQLVGRRSGAAGRVGSHVIGWIIDRTQSTDLGIYILAASIFSGNLLALALPKRIVNR